MAATRKPGANIADAERHTVKRQIRLTPAESAALNSVAEARGVNTSRAVGALAVEAARLGPVPLSTSSRATGSCPCVCKLVIPVYIGDPDEEAT